MKKSGVADNLMHHHSYLHLHPALGRKPPASKLSEEGVGALQMLFITALFLALKHAI